jgi:hypothetical protein
MPRWLWALLLGLVALLLWVGHRGSTPMMATTSEGNSTVRCPLPPALVDNSLPRQSEVEGRLAPFRMGKATISPLAGFSLQARVLGRENYFMGRESEYSPTDLALGWGPMSAPGMAQKLHVSQGGRWYRYGWDSDGPPLPLAQIISNSANMHMVPANAEVARVLDRISTGEQIRIDGWLIRIDSDQGWHWQSSLTRDDSGGGACELVLVCSIQTR